MTWSYCRQKRIDVIGCRSHFAVSPLPQLCGLPLLPVGRLPRGDAPELLFLWRSSRVSGLLTLAGCRSSTAPLMDFAFPTAQVRFRGPLFRQGSKPAYVPPSGFGYPLDGLLPLNPSEPFYGPTAPMGFSPSELGLPARYADVSTAVYPPAVSPAPDVASELIHTAAQAAASGL